MVGAGCGLRQSSRWRHVIPSQLWRSETTDGVRCRKFWKLDQGGGFKKYTSINESWSEVQGVPQRELALAPP